MKNVKNFLLALTVAGISTSVALAQDVFRLGINVGEDVDHGTYNYGNGNPDASDHGAYHQATPTFGAPIVIYNAPPMVYQETVRQYYYAPNVIYRYSDSEHSQDYRGENFRHHQPSNPRWSAGNQGYFDGNNGRNYRGYINDNYQSDGNNHQHRHHYGYR